MFDSVSPHRWQPTRLRHPWDSRGKNTGVGCHFLLQCTKEKSESEVAQSCPTLSNPMDCSLPGSSVHGFSRQEYWSGVPLPSPCQHIWLHIATLPRVKNIYKTCIIVVVLVAKSCPTLATPWTVTCQDPLSIFQARIVEWVDVSFSR